MNPMARLIVATVLLIVSVISGVFAYAVMVMPLEYTIDALVDVDRADVNEVDDTLKSLPFYYAAVIVVFVILLFAWFFAVAHKYEYERE